MKLLFPVLMLVVACSKSVTNTESSTIIPISENKVWLYYDSAFSISGTSNVDTLTISGTASIDGQLIYICSTSRPMLFGTDFNAMRVDSNSIYLVKPINNSEILFFRKTLTVDTVSVNDYYYYYPNLPYSTFPLPDTLDFDFEEIKGVQYHIGYPDQIYINGIAVYKNEKVSLDTAGNELSRQIIYVAPGLGIVKVEFYAMMKDRWFPNRRRVRVSCLNLT